jgi:hypothetical protein
MVGSGGHAGAGAGGSSDADDGPGGHGGTGSNGSDGRDGDTSDATARRVTAVEWRVVIAPATTLYRAPNLIDNNITGFWESNQLHLEPGTWGNGAPVSSFYVGSTLSAASSASPLSHAVHPSLRNPAGCQGKSACFWAEGMYNAGNGTVYALVEDEGWERCPGSRKAHWRMGIVKSTDNGVTFDDAGIILDEPGDDVCNTATPYLAGGVGDGAWIISGDYAYIVYSVYGGTWTPTAGSQGIAVGRILLSDLAAPVQSDPVTGEPSGPSKVKKWYAVRDVDGTWKVPDANGNPSSMPCAAADLCFNSEGISGRSTPIPGSHPSVDNLSTETGPRDMWYFPYVGKVHRDGGDEVHVILASHLSENVDWYGNADKIAAWLGDVSDPSKLLGPIVAVKPCYGLNGAIGTYSTLFGDRVDTLDTSSVMAGDNADGTPRPIPFFGVTFPGDNLPYAYWTLTFCKPGETTGPCSVPSTGGSFGFGLDVECPAAPSR